MDRRESLKLIAWSTISSSLILDACKTNTKKGVPSATTPGAPSIDRMAEEKKAYDRLLGQTFLTADELATVGVLADIIIPADNVSGSATDARVPDFIEFMLKDRPELQTPMRGGLRWLDLQSARIYGKPFRDAAKTEQLALVDAIAYPDRAKPEMKQGVHFFNLMRNLTASGFYTSQIGLKDIGYIGNQATQWNGVPPEVLAQYNLAYSEKEMKECVRFDK
jgi:hypothetical protein